MVLLSIKPAGRRRGIMAAGFPMLLSAVPTGSLNTSHDAAAPQTRMPAWCNQLAGWEAWGPESCPVGRRRQLGGGGAQQGRRPPCAIRMQLCT